MDNLMAEAETAGKCDAEDVCNRCDGGKQNDKMMCFQKHMLKRNQKIIYTPIFSRNRCVIDNDDDQRNTRRNEEYSVKPPNAQVTYDRVRCRWSVKTKLKI